MNGPYDKMFYMKLLNIPLSSNVHSPFVQVGPVNITMGCTTLHKEAEIWIELPISHGYIPRANIMVNYVMSIPRVVDMGNNGISN